MKSLEVMSLDIPTSTEAPTSAAARGRGWRALREWETGLLIDPAAFC